MTEFDNWNGNGKFLQFMGAMNMESFDLSNNVLAEGLTIRAPAESPNTDGIRTSSSNVSLRNINMGIGDLTCNSVCLCESSSY